ncbi:hypothetical protein [Nereida sp. MMG025]|uniref:hypothetical protein n=1 Tax=Nereida sp. MMG025 TaxID=2909981 RepID=UPI001F1604B4|nr:hypothetical protein [Nereida sp. MMG025]MCF6445604.1 hypothetical protein [Nereida sp. MMG025]
MTLPTKGSRPIIFDGHDLRWRYVWSGTSRRGKLVVQGTAKVQLRIMGPNSLEKGQPRSALETITPAVVEKWVRFGIDMGWDPSGDAHYDHHHHSYALWLNDNDQAGPEIPGFVREGDPTPRLTRPAKPST